MDFNEFSIVKQDLWFDVCYRIARVDDDPYVIFTKLLADKFLEHGVSPVDYYNYAIDRTIANYGENSGTVKDVRKEAEAIFTRMGIVIIHNKPATGKVYRGSLNV